MLSCYVSSPKHNQALRARRTNFREGFRAEFGVHAYKPGEAAESSLDPPVLREFAREKEMKPKLAKGQTRPGTSPNGVIKADMAKNVEF